MTEHDNDDHIVNTTSQTDQHHNDQWVEPETRIAFFRAARMCEVDTIRELVGDGVSINLVENGSGFTALHYAAARKGRRLRQFLLRNKNIDHLKRDRLGRLPSELAGTIAADLRVARQLRTRELAQAQERGITLTYRPRPPATED